MMQGVNTSSEGDVISAQGIMGPRKPYNASKEPLGDPKGEQVSTHGDQDNRRQADQQPGPDRKSF